MNHQMQFKDPVEKRLSPQIRLAASDHINMLCGTDISETRMYNSSHFQFTPRFETHHQALLFPYRENLHIPNSRVFEHWAYDKHLNPIEIADHYKPILIGYADNKQLPVYPFKQVSEFEQVKGVSYYMGLLNPHYGHFIQESITRLWLTLDEPELINRNTRFVFHVFDNFGPQQQAAFFNSSLMEFLNAMGIDKQQLVFVTKAMRVENLIVPETAIAISDGNCYLSHAARKVWQHVNHLMASSNKFASGHFKKAKKKIYLSRAAVKNPIQGRVLKNEPEVEKAFKRLGFDIVMPEHLTQKEMQTLLRDTQVIASNPGSGLQNSFFIPEPATAIGLTCLPVMQINPGLNHQIHTDLICGHQTLGFCAAKEDIQQGQGFIHWTFDTERLMAKISEAIEA